MVLTYKMPPHPKSVTTLSPKVSTARLCLQRSHKFPKQSHLLAKCLSLCLYTGRSDHHSEQEQSRGRRSSWFDSVWILMHLPVSLQRPCVWQRSTSPDLANDYIFLQVNEPDDFSENSPDLQCCLFT